MIINIVFLFFQLLNRFLEINEARLFFFIIKGQHVFCLTGCLEGCVLILKNQAIFRKHKFQINNKRFLKIIPLCVPFLDSHHPENISPPAYGFSISAVLFKSDFNNISFNANTFGLWSVISDRDDMVKFYYPNMSYHDNYRLTLGETLCIRKNTSWVLGGPLPSFLSTKLVQW